MKKMTTVKIDEDLYESFKIQNIQTKFELKELVNRCMYLYMNDPEFRKRIYEYQIPILSQNVVEAVEDTTFSLTPTDK